MGFRQFDRIAGHAWTILPTLRHQLAPVRLPVATTWSTTVADPDAGPVIVRGEYSQGDGHTLVIGVHGLGGSPSSAYLGPIAIAAHQRGWSSLRISLRGTDGIGNDFYHAGLTEDVKIALRDAAFAQYQRVFVVGFSLGGHIAMRLATEADTDPRVTAVAAVCPILDLSAGATKLDEPGQFIYRQHILNELRQLYRGVAQTARVPTPWERIALVRHIREWDALTIVPRFGFDDVEDYYRTMSVSNRMDQLRIPTLMVHSHDDPVVIPETVYPAIENAPPLFEAHWFDGAGHVYFPPSFDIGAGSSRGIGPQVLSWLDNQQ